MPAISTGAFVKAFKTINILSPGGREKSLKQKGPKSDKITKVKKGTKMIKTKMDHTLKELASNDNFWDILYFLDSQKDEILIDAIKSECQCSEEDVYKTIQFLQLFQHKFQFRFSEKGLIIVPPKNNAIFIEMNLPEWFAFQSCLSRLSETRPTRYSKILVNKFFNIKMPSSNINLFDHSNKRNTLEHPFGTDSIFIHKINSLKNAISNENLVSIVLNNNETLEFYPHKILFLEKKCSCIGEELPDKNLIAISIHEIEVIQTLESISYTPNFSYPEIDDFINALRAVSGNEVRLILKIHNPDKVNISPDYHFFGSPYLATNPEGDLIWAASVEVSDDFFDWLYTIKDEVEIVENSKLQNEFNDYQKRRQKHLKHVS